MIENYKEFLKHDLSDKEIQELLEFADDEIKEWRKFKKAITFKLTK